MSHWTAAVESLESRTLLSGTPLDWPFVGPGASRIGRTLYIAGTDGVDTIRIDFVPGATAGAPDPRQIQVVFNNLKVNNQVPRLQAAPLRRVLINGAGGNDDIRIAGNLPKSFHPRVFNIRGGAGNDNILGGGRNELILGEAGTDNIDGGGGRDRIDGGDGDDTLNGGNGADRLFGGAGNDRIIGGPGQDVFFGGIGDDTLKNLESFDQRPGGPEGPHDILFGGPGDDKCDFDPADEPSNDIEHPNANLG